MSEEILTQESEEMTEEELAEKRRAAAEQDSSDEEEDEEELGLIYELLGQGILLLPIIISIALGAYKSLGYVTEFGTIS